MEKFSSKESENQAVAPAVANKRPASSQLPVKLLPASQIIDASKQKGNISTGPGSVKLSQDTQKCH